MKKLNRICDKLKEADFFLEKMIECDRRIEELNYYFSAFASSARSVTFVLQYVGSAIEEFNEWYENIQNRLKKDKVAKYLLEARNESLKTGSQPISYGEIIKLPNGDEKLVNFFSYIGANPPAEVPDMDVVESCRHQMKNLVEIISEFFEKFERKVWNLDLEKNETLEYLNQIKPLVHGGNTPEILWEELVSVVNSPKFTPPTPSESIKKLTEKYA